MLNLIANGLSLLGWLGLTALVSTTISMAVSEHRRNVR